MIDPQSGFCSPQQLAKDPGLRARFTVAPATRAGVQKAILAGRIPAKKVGSRWVIDLAAYADSLRVHPADLDAFARRVEVAS